MKELNRKELVSEIESMQNNLNEVLRVLNKAHINTKRGDYEKENVLTEYETKLIKEKLERIPILMEHSMRSMKHLMETTGRYYVINFNEYNNPISNKRDTH